jgi:heme-degrading monooxygenase HmoA
MIAKTPKPPYYAVIFSSIKKEIDESYNLMSERMMNLAKLQDGFLGVESARSEVGITVSYWKDLESIKKWKLHAAHTEAREKGRSTWYNAFKVRICNVERDYEFEK